MNLFSLLSFGVVFVLRGAGSAPSTLAPVNFPELAGWSLPGSCANPTRIE